MIRFAVFDSLHQQQPKILPFKSGSFSSPGKSRSMTWKKYSTELHDQTVTGMIIRFAVLDSLHQQQPKILPFKSGSFSSPGKSRSKTWKKYSTEFHDQTVTGMMIRFAVFDSLHQQQPKILPFNSWSFSLSGKSRSMTWKKYSTELHDQMVTRMMIRFAVFDSLHQQQPKILPFQGHFQGQDGYSNTA